MLENKRWKCREIFSLNLIPYISSQIWISILLRLLFAFIELITDDIAAKLWGNFEARGDDKSCRRLSDNPPSDSNYDDDVLISPNSGPVFLSDSEKLTFRPPED